MHNSKYNKKGSISGAFLVLSLGALLLLSLFQEGSLTGLSVYESDDQTDFDEGTYFQTNYNGTALVLNSTYSEGLWTSKKTYTVDTLDNISFSYRGVRGELSGTDDRSIDDYTDGLVGLWHFNNAEGNIIDYSEVGNDLLNNGATLGTNGKLMNSTEFLGNGAGYLNKANPSNLPTLEGTIAVWVKLDSWVNSEDDFFVEYGTGNSNRIILYRNDNEDLRMLVANSGADLASYDCSGFDISKWYHVVGTFNSTNIEIYVNGDKGIGDTGRIASAPTNLRVGCGLFDSGGCISSRNLDGKIDEVAIWNRSLSECEIRDIYERQKEGIIDNTNLEFEYNISYQVNDSGNWKYLSQPYCQYNFPNEINEDASSFQVRVNMSTNNVSLTPEFYNITAGYTPYVDNEAPIISNVSTTNVTNETATIEWDTDEVSNSTIIYGTSSGNLNQSYGESDFVSYHNLTLTNLEVNTTYFYNVTSCDPAGNCNSSGIYNFTTLENIISNVPPTVNLISPENGNYTINNNVTFICNASDDSSVVNITLFTNVGGWQPVSTNAGDSLTHTVNNIPNGNYEWNCLAYDDNDNSNFASSNFTLTVNYTYIDSEDPTVNLISPENNKIFNSTNNVVFTISATDNYNLSNCTLYTNITGWQANGTKEFTGMSDSDTWNINNISLGDYIWNAYCCDTSDNCAWNLTNSTFIINYTGTPACTENWIVNYTECNISDQRVKYYTDNNSCGTTDNLPGDNGTVEACDYCTPSLTNTSWTDWINLTCFSGQMNQSRNRTQYDQNNCYAQTGLIADNVTNVTYFEYQLAGPNLVNTSWTDWLNISCLSNDKMNQTRNRTQYDTYGCSANQTFTEYRNTEFCDYCTPSLTNTSWTDWLNISCLSNDKMNQSRNRTQFDSNYCGEVANQTFVEYRATEDCQYCTPDLVNTSWSLWYDVTGCRINDTILQERNRTQYDNNSCGGANQTFFEYKEIGCNYCDPDPTNTSFTGWQNQGTCSIEDKQLQNRSKTEYDSNYSTCYAVTNLPADLWNSGNNNTYWEFQNITCNYCTENIQGPTNTSCNLSNQLIQYYQDLNYNTCCAVTGLSSDCHIDNGTYDNQTLACVYDSDAPEFNESTIESDGDTYNQTDNVIFNLCVNENSTLEAKVEWDSTSSQFIMNYNGTEWCYTYTFTNTTYPGDYDIIFNATDNAGNSNTTTSNFTVNDVTSPKVEVIEPSQENYTQGNTINISVNVSDFYYDNLNTVIANITWDSTYKEITLTYDSGLWKSMFTNTTDIDTYNITIIATDNAGNKNDSEYKLFNILEDIDNDNQPDEQDYLIWNEDDVSSSGLGTLDIRVNSNTDIDSSGWAGVNTLEFYEGPDLFMNFTHNFTNSSKIYLSKVKIERSDTGIAVNLSGQLLENERKTLYLLGSGFDSLCVKDEEIASINDISDGCNGDNETDFTPCIGNSGGTTIDNITCRDLGDRIEVSNLKYSGIKATKAAVTSTGGGSPSCTSFWQCTSWSSCEDGQKSRVCIDQNKCGSRYEITEHKNCGVSKEPEEPTEETKEPVVEPEEPEEKPVEPTEEKPIEQKPVEEPCKLFGMNFGFWLFMCWYWWILVIILLTLAYLVYIYLKDKKIMFWHREICPMCHTPMIRDGKLKLGMKGGLRRTYVCPKCKYKAIRDEKQKDKKYYVYCPRCHSDMKFSGKIKTGPRGGLRKVYVCPKCKYKTIKSEVKSKNRSKKKTKKKTKRK